MFDDEHGDYIIRYHARIDAPRLRLLFPCAINADPFHSGVGISSKIGTKYRTLNLWARAASARCTRLLAATTRSRHICALFNVLFSQHAAFACLFCCCFLSLEQPPLPIVRCIHDLNTKSPIVCKSCRILSETLAAQVVRVYDTVGKTYLAMKVLAPPHLSPNHHRNLGSSTRTQTCFPHSEVHLNPIPTLRNVTPLSTKIIKNKRAFHEQAQVEIQMLSLFKNFGEVSMWCGVPLSFCPSVTRRRLRSITAALFACWTALCTGTISV